MQNTTIHLRNVIQKETHGKGVEIVDEDLPELVRACWSCSGTGSSANFKTKYEGPTDLFRCSWCNGVGYVYKHNSEPVGESVVNQILMTKFRKL